MENILEEMVILFIRIHLTYLHELFMYLFEEIIFRICHFSSSNSYQLP